MVRPLPGISFQAVPPELGEKLPRMDVAAFVGFAAAGPIGTPVVVEDEVHFRRIFGDDLPLAWDEATGQAHRAYLGAAVRAFFRNGGRRCWVVRVASAQATANRFLLPGLMRADAAGVYRAARVAARSEGAWSDYLRAGTALVADPFRVLRFAREGDQLEIALSRLSRQSLQPGDLLRFTFPAAVLYLAVGGVTGTGQAWQVEGQEFWFRREPVVADPPSDLDIWIRHPEGRRRRLKNARWAAPAQHGGVHRIFVPGAGVTPGPGTLLELETDNYPTLYLSVMESRTAYPAELTGLGSGTWTVLAGRDPLGPCSQRVGRALAWGVDESEILAERLTCELWVEDGDAQPYRLGNLGFCPGHPRYLGDLPTDTRLFRSREEGHSARPEGPAPGRHLWPDVVEPRFPLAGDGGPTDIYLPLGMDWQARREYFAGPLPVTAPAEARNGMASFDPQAFLDPDLAGLSSDALRGAIFQKRDVQGKALMGLHAVWPLEEVTLLALPDAIHPPWAEDTSSAILPPPAPILSLSPTHLTWTPIPEKTGYVVQLAGDPAFAGPSRTLTVGGTTLALPNEGGCPEVRYYRVRALREDQQGPWSNTQRLILDASDFEACSPAELVDAPVLAEPVALGEHRFQLSWSAGTPGATYTVEEAADPDLFGARSLDAGSATSLVIVRHSDQPTYYRVRAVKEGRVSPWSRTAWVLESDPRQVLKLRPDLDSPSDHLTIHEAALRFALARADLLTVLTMPVAYRELEAVSYSRSLVGRLQSTEERALTYGALYHPWVWTREGTEPARLIPPDGAMTGQMARVAFERGAWIAPANHDLPGAVALAPTLTDAAWSLFAENRINLVQRTARGFLALSADTLGQDDEYRLINVRRFLILLRRLALQEGARLVFEPNNEAFRRLVQRRFEALLSDLYTRGALAGASVEDAFRVLTGPSVNPRTASDEGRFVVELQVAPSRPLAFLTVRLIQAQGAGPAFQEV